MTTHAPATPTVDDATRRPHHSSCPHRRSPNRDADLTTTAPRRTVRNGAPTGLVHHRRPHCTNQRNAPAGTDPDHGRPPAFTGYTAPVTSPPVLVPLHPARNRPDDFRLHLPCTPPFSTHPTTPDSAPPGGTPHGGAPPESTHPHRDAATPANAGPTQNPRHHRPPHSVSPTTHTPGAGSTCTPPPAPHTHPTHTHQPPHPPPKPPSNSPRFVHCRWWLVSGGGLRCLLPVVAGVGGVCCVGDRAGSGVVCGWWVRWVWWVGLWVGGVLRGVCGVVGCWWPVVVCDEGCGVFAVAAGVVVAAAPGVSARAGRRRQGLPCLRRRPRRGRCRLRLMAAVSTAAV